MYPIVVGHETVGTVIRVGSKVTEFKTGDVVGVGANSWSCGECHAYERDLEQHCVSRSSAP
jgi:D-arabinose 1-dehydrogenase-like Zn-dependent alcohol dehydrogenase